MRDVLRLRRRAVGHCHTLHYFTLHSYSLCCLRPVVFTRACVFTVYLGGDGDDLVIGDTADIDSIESRTFNSASVTSIFNIINEVAPAFRVQTPSIAPCFVDPPSGQGTTVHTFSGVSVHRNEQCKHWYTCAGPGTTRPAISADEDESAVLYWGARCCHSIADVKQALAVTLAHCTGSNEDAQQDDIVQPLCFNTDGAAWANEFTNIIRKWESTGDLGGFVAHAVTVAEGSRSIPSKISLVTEKRAPGAHVQLTCLAKDATTARIRADANAKDIAMWSSSCCRRVSENEIAAIIDSLPVQAGGRQPTAPLLDVQSVPCQFSKPGFLSLASRQCLRRPGTILTETKQAAQTISLTYHLAQLSYTHDSRWPRIECATNLDHYVTPFLSVQQLLEWNEQCCAASEDTAQVIFSVKECTATSFADGNRAHAPAHTNASAPYTSSMYSKNAGEQPGSQHECKECASEFGCHDAVACTGSNEVLRLKHGDHGTRIYVPVQYLPYAYHGTEGFSAEMHQRLTSVMSDQRQQTLQSVGANTFLEVENAEDGTTSTEQVFIAFVPALNYQAHQLPGNDNITGGSGRNTLVGDTVTVATHIHIPESNNKMSQLLQFTVDTIAQNLLRFSTLSLDTYTFETQVIGETHMPQLLRIGNDRFVSSSGTDVTVGDSLFLITPMNAETIAGLDVDAGAFFTGCFTS